MARRIADKAAPLTRKSQAGPQLLGTFAAPGARKKSVMAVERKKEDEGNEFQGFGPRAKPKDNTTIDGRINIISQIEGVGEPLCCKYNEEFELLAAGYADGVIRLYSSETNEHMFNLSDAEVTSGNSPTTSIKHRPVSKNYPVTNSFTCTYSNGCVKCWNYNFNQCIYTIRERRQTYGVVYHPRLAKFVTYGDDLKIYLYDEESKTQERVLTKSDDTSKHDGHTSRVFAACFNPRSNHELITGGWDNVVQFWDLRQAHAIRHLSGIHICGEGLDINSRGTELLTCAWQKDNPIKLFDYGSGKLITALEPDIHNGKMYCGRYASKEFIVVGGSDPNMIRIIDMQTYLTTASVMYLPGSVYCVDLGPTKKMKRTGPDSPLKGRSDLAAVPRIAFVSGKKLYQIDFY